MNIVGIISQGRGAGIPQFITQFTVEYRLGDNLGANVVLSGPFYMTDGSKKVHILPVLTYARYLRILVVQWIGYISMRAGLLVRSCASCPSKAVSLQGSTANNNCESVAADASGPGWTGSPRIAVRQSNPVWKLASYVNEISAMVNTLVLPGIILPGIIDGGFYRSRAGVFNTSDFGRTCMSYSFWIRPAPLLASTWEQIICSSNDEKFTVGFFVGRYVLWLPLHHRNFGDTHNLFLQDTWTHVVVQIGLNGMHYLHIDGIAIFSRSVFSVAQFANIDVFVSQTGYTNAIARGISLTYGQTPASHAPIPPMTTNTAPTGPINIGGFYADFSVAGARQCI